MIKENTITADRQNKIRRPDDEKLQKAEYKVFKTSLLLQVALGILRYKIH